MIRRVWSALWGCFTVFLSAFGTAAVLPFSPGGSLGAFVVRWWAKITLWGMLVKVDLKIDPAVGEGPYVVVANHASMLDIPASAATVPVRFHFVSRPFFFKVPFLGWGMFFSRSIALDPKKPKAAAKVLKTLGQRFERGLSVLLYPEGTRSPDGTVKRYKRGPFMTAIEHGVPVLPVYLGGTAALLPKKALLPKPGTIHVTIGAPIPTKDLPHGDPRETLASARAIARQAEGWTREQEQG